MKRFLLLSFIVIANWASAQIPVAKKGTFVNDYVSVLTPAEIKALNQKIYIIQQETKVQLAVVLVNKIPAAYTIKSFATGIGRKWHVGTKKRGLVYVAAVDEHSQRLSVAQNLTTVFTPEKSDAILSSMKTAYRNADYAGGLTILVNKIHTTLVPQAEVKQQPKPVLTAVPAKAEDKAVTKEDNSDILPGIIFFSVVILLVVIIYYRGKLKQQRIATEAMLKLQDMQNGGYKQGGYGSGVRGYSGGGYSSAGRRPVQNGRRSSTGSFLTGAALGAAGGYGARYLQDKLNEQHQNSNHHDDYNVATPDSFASTPIDSDNNESNWGNWGGGDQDNDGGFSDDDNDASYDSGSSSDDSGYSDSSDDSSGSTSNW